MFFQTLSNAACNIPLDQASQKGKITAAGFSRKDSLDPGSGDTITRHRAEAVLREKPAAVILPFAKLDPEEYYKRVAERLKKTSVSTYVRVRIIQCAASEQSSF